MSTASDWWVYFFGKGTQDAYDYTGRQIKKAAFGQAGSKYCWVLEHILPPKYGGTNTVNNFHIVSLEAFMLRDERLTYVIDGTCYQVQRGSNGYEIKKMEDKKLTFWEKEFGNALMAYDFSGKKVRRIDYGNDNSPYGWDIDHIQPLAKNGPDNDGNKQIVNIQTNKAKADKTTFKIGNTTYQVQKTSKSDEDAWADYDYSDKKYCIVEIYD